MQSTAVSRIINEVFGNDAEIWLFGSRVDEARRGGDVDLYVIPVGNENLYGKRVVCLSVLEAVLLYPVDLVVADKSAASRPIDHIALKTGVLL